MTDLTALLLRDAVYRVHEQNDELASLERLESAPTTHRIGQRRRRTSWLRSFQNPLRGLLGFARTNGATDDATYTPCPKQVIEDERLARVVALALHPQQGERVKPANGILCVVIGCGPHGRSVAGELLRRGCTVRLYDALPYLAECALASIRETLEQLVRVHLLLSCDVETLLARCTVSDCLEAAVVRDPSQVGPLLIVEAVPDFVDVKWLVFDEVVGACVRSGVRPQDVLLCSNTLACGVAELATCVPSAYAARLLGMRFLHPCWFVDMVDVSLVPPRPATDDFVAHTEMAQAIAHVMRVLGLAAAVPDAGRLLSEEEVALYAVRQSMRVEGVEGEEKVELCVEL